MKRLLQTILSARFALLLSVMAVMALPSAAQTQKLTLKLDNATVETAIMELQQKYGYSVAVKSNDIDMKRTISVSADNEEIDNVLKQILAGQDVTFSVKGKSILITKAREEQTAQPKIIRVTGKVIDDKGMPVIGATVVDKENSTNGTTTDVDGNYSIDIAQNGVLDFSFLGYESLETVVNNRTKINVTLKPGAEDIDAVVVVGYGVESKKLVSSSIATVKMDDVDRGAEIDPIKALQGRVTGVSVSNASGIPGATPNVIVRGVSSISGNSTPLYVVDGIPAESYPNINAADIESMEVLKDASATAIYGSRANSGVVIITTKSGSKGKTTVDIEGYYGAAQVAHDIPMANTQQYINVMQTAIDNYNTQMNQIKELYIPANPADYDWVGAISRKLALRGGATASISGGTDKTLFYVSTGVEQQQGYLNTTEFKKYTGRAKFSHEIAKWLKLNLNLSGAYARYDMVEETDGSLKLLRAAREEQPWYTPYNEDGSYRVMSTDGITRHNPVMMINEEDYYINKYQLQGTISFDVTPVKGLKWTPSISGYSIYDKTIKKLTENHTDRGYKDGWHALSEQKDNSFRYVIDNVLSYNNSAGLLLYSVMAGHSFEKYEYETFGAASDNYANGAFPSSSFGLITSGSEIYAGSIGYNAYALESYFFRGALNWDNRYIVNFSFRADGSSRFPKNNRFGFFPAASVAWIISNEKFMPKTDVLNELKLRLSAGQTGSMNGISNWAAMSLVSAGASYNGSSGLQISQSAQNLKWEKSTKYNVGLDLEMFNGRMNATLDAFYSRTDDLLYNKPVVSTTGYTSIASNIGSMDNYGVEFSIGGRVIDRAFKWDLNANVSYNKNKLVKLLDNTDIIVVSQAALYGGNKHALIIGQPVSTWYMLRMDGIYQRDEDVPAALYEKGVRAGDVKYYDKNGDGDIDDNDRVICGKATPDVFGGINSSMTWKGLELTIFCQYSIGGKIFAAWKGCGQEGTESLGLSSGAVSVPDSEGTVTQYFNVSRDAALNYWRGEGTSNTVPRPLIAGAHTGYDVDYNLLTSSRYLEDASYFKIKTVTLAYNLPQKWMQKIRMRGIKVYFTVDNALTFTKYDGYDPEVSMSSGPASAGYGTDFGYSPTMRSYLFGAQFKF